jgi:hypothetical protein
MVSQTGGSVPIDAVLDRHAYHLADLVMEDSEINNWVIRKAKERSGTQYWTPEEWEQNENTTQYDLYWSEHVRFQCMVMSRALSIQLGISTA